MSENPETANADSGTQPESLWPKKFIATKLRPPVALLREQATLLGDATQNVITAGVITDAKSSPGELLHNFRIIAPGLGNYRVLLFTVAHTVIDIYPLRITSELLASDREVFKEWKAKDEGGFKAILKEIFANPKTSKVIESLLVQSEGYDPNEQPPF